MLKAFDWSPWIKAITIKLYCCTSSFNWWFKFRFIWSQRNCCISYFHFPPLQNHHSNRNMCQHCTMLILNPQDLKSCWWITWRPSFECSSWILFCPPNHIFSSHGVHASEGCIRYRSEPQASSELHRSGSRCVFHHSCIQQYTGFASAGNTHHAW